MKMKEYWINVYMSPKQKLFYGSIRKSKNIKKPNYGCKLLYRIHVIMK